MGTESGGGDVWEECGFEVTAGHPDRNSGQAFQGVGLDP